MVWLRLDLFYPIGETYDSISNNGAHWIGCRPTRRSRLKRVQSNAYALGNGCTSCLSCCRQYQRPVRQPFRRKRSATGNEHATGTVDGTFNAQTSLLAWTVTYSGMSGNVTAAHFHGPAIVGENAGVAAQVTGSTANPIKGEAMLTGEQAADLTSGKWYFNRHTAANPNGEIRGQVAVNPITARAQ